MDYLLINKFQYIIFFLVGMIILVSFSSLILNYTGVLVIKSPPFSSPTMELLESIMYDDSNDISIELNSGANVNESGKDGITPLIYLVIKSNQSGVVDLLKLGANPNLKQDDGYNALTVAYELSGTAPLILETLIKSKQCDLNILMPDGEPLLYYLIASGKLNFLEMALKKGANPSLHTIDNYPLVISAAIIEEYNAVQLLLDAGASPVATDTAGTSLLIFVKTGSVQEIDPNGDKNKNRLHLLERLQKNIIK